MCHLLSEWVFARKFLSFRRSCHCAALPVLAVLQSRVCASERKFSSNYRFIASFPSQHFDCLQISTFPVMFIHNILDVCRRQRFFSQLLFILSAPFARIAQDDACKAPVWSHESSSETRISASDANKVLTAFDRTAPCPVDSSQLYRLSRSNICCLLIFFLVFFFCPPFFLNPNTPLVCLLRQSVPSKRWNYYSLVQSRVRATLFANYVKINEEACKLCRWCYEEVFTTTTLFSSAMGKARCSWRNVPLTSWRS